MAQRDWDDEYARILGEASESGRIEPLPDSSEKRRDPRFAANGAEILVTEQVPRELADLSVSGMAFYSDRELPTGQTLLVSLRQVLVIQAEVMGCETLTEPDAPAPFRVRCRFSDTNYGLRFLVLALEMQEEEQH